jgi:uncharacterized membrane protein YeaQ/YmgE (transglycosylase-associated protein family)
MTTLLGVVEIDQAFGDRGSLVRVVGVVGAMLVSIIFGAVNGWVARGIWDRRKAAGSK